MFVLLTLFISITGLFCMLITPAAAEYYLSGSNNDEILYQLMIPAAIISGVIVIVSTLITVSPFGEWIARMVLGGRELAGREKIFIGPILDNVIQQAALKGKTIRAHPYIVDDPFPMSYAIGKGTVVLTSGLLKQADEAEIAGGLAHEIGHLYHEDSKRSLAQWGALLPLILYYKLWIIIIKIMQKSGIRILAIASIILFILIIPYKFIIEIWAIVGRKVSQRIEYRADAFAANIGEREGLIRLLERYSDIDNRKWSLFEQLMSTHPPTMYRIGKLENIE